MEQGFLQCFSMQVWSKDLTATLYHRQLWAGVAKPLVVRGKWLYHLVVRLGTDKKIEWELKQNLSELRIYMENPFKTSKSVIDRF